MKNHGDSLKADLDSLDDDLIQPRIVFFFPASVDNALLNYRFSSEKTILAIWTLLLDCCMMLPKNMRNILLLCLRFFIPLLGLSLRSINHSLFSVCIISKLLT